MGRAWRVTDAGRIVDRVCDVMAGFREVALACDVPEASLGPVLADLRRRGAKLAKRSPAPG